MYNLLVALGVIIWEYMSDKTIYNKAFNILSIATVLMILGSIGIDVSRIIVEGYLPYRVLVVFNNALRLVMVFMFTFFVYDSAKMQLKKVNFSK